MPPRYSEAEYERLKSNDSPESEHEVQKALFQWAEAQSAHTHALSLLYAIPNGQYRPGQRPEPGIQSGVPDLCLPVPSPPYHGLYLELKRDGGRLRDNQKDWLHELRGYGYAARVAYGFEEAKTTLEQYLDGTLPSHD